MKTHYTLQGTPNSPVLMFSNSLGCNLSMWDELVPDLLPYFRVLQYDTRGHGSSEFTPGPYSVDLLGQDVLDLLDKLQIDKVHFCGLSMGGLIGQWLGIHHPERLHKLILSNTGSKIGTEASWNDRINTLTEKGMASIVEATMERWFTAAFRRENASRVAQLSQVFLDNRVAGYTACCAVVRDADFRGKLSAIALETLILTGDEDEVTNVDHAEKMRMEIPGSQIKVLPARHLASTEQPALFAETLIDFIVGGDSYSRGMHVRRTVLGDAHVDRANQNKNQFNADFQEFISQYAWGEIWTRPGLPKPSRSLITLAMLIPLNKKTEFKMHIKAASNNGVTVEEIKELILQSGIYCGLPAANDAMHAAEEVFAELGILIN